LIDTNIEKYGGTDWVEYDIDSPIPDEEWPWTIPTDLDRAEELLDLAGFPRDSDGVRFEINLNKYRCETGSLCLEQADVVASGWEEVGVRTTVLTENYRTVVHLRMKDRIQAWPVVKNCDVETANYSFDWPPPRSDTTFTRLNWGCSFESKFLDYMLVNISGAWEKAEREKMHLDMVDYFYYWQLYSGIVQLPRGIAANPDTIESWNSRSVQSGFWSSPQHIVPKQ
jgi:ABC-type transport system substrate-binding protein